MSTSFWTDTQSTTTLSLVLDSLVSPRKGSWGAFKLNYLSARQSGVFHALSWLDRDQSLDTECIRVWQGNRRRGTHNGRQLLDLGYDQENQAYLWTVQRTSRGPGPVSEDA